MPTVELCKSCKNKISVLYGFCNFCFDEKAQKTLENLRKKPEFDLYQELGEMLLRNVDDFSKEERSRYDELKSILGIGQDKIKIK
jgi:predicted amidophosphoribosyltransferase